MTRLNLLSYPSEFPFGEPIQSMKGKGRVHPKQCGSPLQGNTETYSHAHSQLWDNVKPPVNLPTD